VAVEPKQEIEKLAAKHEPFNVFLRVHRIRRRRRVFLLDWMCQMGGKAAVQRN